MAVYSLRIGTVHVTADYAPIPMLDVDNNSIPAVVSNQTTTVYQTSSAGYTYSSQIAGLPWIPAATLATSQYWLVRYQASFGGATSGTGSIRIPEIGVITNRLGGNPPNSDRVYGGGEGLGVGLSSFLPEASRCCYTAGWFLFTPDGTDLEFRMRTTAGSPPPTSYSGMSLIAIPVTDFQDARKIQLITDMYGSQMTPVFGTQGAPSPTVVTTAPFATIWSHGDSFSTGSYLILASAQGDTITGDKVQYRFSIDGVVQKHTATRLAKDVRDDFSFVYEGVHSINQGLHTLLLEGGSAGGVGNKTFRNARIWAIKLDNFERWGYTKDDPLFLSTAEYPNWNNNVVGRTIAPFSSVGEYALVVGNSFCDVPDQCGIMTRLYNNTTSTALHEFSSFMQVDDIQPGQGPGDTYVLSTVGCELINTEQTYYLQHCRANAPANPDVNMVYREIVVVGLTKKAAPPPPTVTINVFDSSTTNETQSTPVSGIGILSPIEYAQGADFVSLTGDSPPSGIPNMHPRLPWFTPAKISALRARAGYDDFGNNVNPPGSAFWQDLLVDASNLELHDNGRDYSHWIIALKAVITQNQTHIDDALRPAIINRVCNPDLQSSFENGGLTAGHCMRQAAMYYDLLYNHMTSAQKKQLQNYMMGAMYLTCNDPLGYWSPSPDRHWGRNTPNNNYHSSFVLCAAYMATVLYWDVWPNANGATWDWPPTGGITRQWIMPLYEGQTSGPTYTDGLDYMKARMQNVSFPTYDKVVSGGVVGGGWHEGSWYRPMWRIYESWRLMDELVGWLPSHENINPTDFIYYNIHACMPGSTRAPELGDSGSAQSRKFVGPEDRSLMLYLADRYRNQADGQYAQYWLTHVVTATEPGRHEWDGNDFLWGDPTIPEIDYRAGAIPKYWYSRGNQLVLSRTGWTTSDHCVMISSTDRIELHTHGEQNAIQVYSGLAGSSTDDCFVVGPRCAHGSSGENQGNDWRSLNHSTYRLGGTDQRGSRLFSPIYPGDDLITTGNIDKFFPGNDYVYAQGNAKDAYRLTVVNYYDTINPNKKCCDVFLREFLHIPTVAFLLTYDRILLRQNTPDGTVVPQTVEAHLHYPKPAPVISGDILTLNVGASRNFRKFIYPAGQASTIIDENQEDTSNGSPLSFSCVDEDIDLAVVGGYARLGTALEITSSAQPSMSPSLPIVASASMEGATITKSGLTYHALFSKSQTGAVPGDPFNYDVNKASDADIHIVCNLQPNQQYFVTQSAQGGGVFRYSFSVSLVGFFANSAGIVRFTPAQLADQTTAFINTFDFARTGEFTTPVADSVIALPFPDVALCYPDRVILVSQQNATIVVNDTSDTAEFSSITGPLDVYDSSSTFENVSLVGEAPPPGQEAFWAEKEIAVGTSPLRPNSDRAVSFFDPDPADGALWDKVADDDDATFLQTNGFNAAFASVDFGLSAPASYIGRLRVIQPVVRVSFCDLQNSLNPQIRTAITGLGLTVLTQTFKSKPLISTSLPMDIVFDPLVVNIESFNFDNMGLSVSVSGNPIGGKFLLRISEVYLNILSSSSSEKVIS